MAQRPHNNSQGTGSQSTHQPQNTPQVVNTPNYQPSSQQGLNYWDTPARRASAEAPSNPNVASYQANLPQSNSAPNVASSQAHVPQNANNNQGNVRAGRPRPPDYTADEMRTIRTMMDRGDSAAAVALVLPGRSASAIHAKYWRLRGGDPKARENARREAERRQRDPEG